MQKRKLQSAWNQTQADTASREERDMVDEGRAPWNRVSNRKRNTLKVRVLLKQGCLKESRRSLKKESFTSKSAEIIKEEKRFFLFYS